MTKKERLVAAIQAASNELSKKAEDFVGDTEWLSDVSIWIHIRDDRIPEIEVNQTYISHQAFQVMNEYDN